MSVSIQDFWKLILDSRLLTHEQCHALGTEFAGVKGAVATANAKSLSQFLIARNALTAYQSTVLLAGRSGPFFYGDYKVYDRIDQGRLAGLFRAIHVPTSHLVTLQFFSGPVTQDPNLWAAMVQQSLAHGRVVHPHLQRWHEPIDLTSFKFLVGEDLQGESLDQRLGTCGPLPAPEACRVVRAAAMGLAQMHQAGLVHGDLRPLNLWFEPSGNIKLLRDPAATSTPIHLTPPDQASQLLIKSDYLAPELAQQGKMHDALTDIYGLGCTLYHLLSGRPPFAGGDVMQKLGRHASERIAPLEAYGVPPQIGQVVAYMMAKNPGVRYQQANMVVEQLAPFIDPAYLYAQPPPPPFTLCTYETWVAQKQAALSGTPYAAQPSYAVAAQPQSAFPEFDVSRRKTSAAPVGPPGTASAGLPQIAVSPVAGLPGAVAPATDIKPASVPVAVSKHTHGDIHKDELAELEGGFANKKTRNLAIGLAVVAVLAIVGVIALNAMGGKKTGENGDGVVNSGNAGGGTETEDSTKPKGAGVKGTAGLPTGSNAPSDTVVTTTNSGTSGTPGGTVVKTPGTTVVGSSNGGTKTPGTTVKPGTTPAAEVGITQEVVNDDGNLLWASPTSGKPVSLAYMAPGSQIFLLARPADLLASAEGARVLTALGPTFATSRTAWETASGFKLEEIEQLVVGLYENEGKVPRPVLAVHLKSPVPEAEILGRWGDPEPTSHGKGAFYNVRGWAMHIPPAAKGKTFVMGSAPEIKEVIDFQGAQPALLREIERLRNVSDERRHFTLFFAPKYLFNEEGEKLLAGDFEKVRSAASWLLGEDLGGGMLSLHFGNETYAEVRLIAKADKQKFDLAKEFKGRLEQIPDLIESYNAELNPPAFWRKLANRYPAMIRFLHQQTRVGVEDDQAVVNAVLPASAGHNLFLASELVISSAPGAPTTVVSTAGPTKPPAPKNIDELLAVKMSLSFAQDSLEFSMQNVVNQVKQDYSSLPFEFKVVLMGNDMKIDGITKNQSIRDFNEKDKTVSEILTAMVRKANPITTVTDPSELDQKLIWVIGPDPDSAEKQCILVTTRAAAEKNGYKLPPQFVPKPG